MEKTSVQNVVLIYKRDFSKGENLKYGKLHHRRNSNRNLD